jgi:NAD(P)-dependent dehydrogenase (short-subunit alcohol dehydrogenase family)
MKILPGRFAGKRAVVTGASAGIGRATALRLAAEGARVGLIARRREPLEEVAAEIARSGAEALVLPADSSVETEVAAAMDAAANRWGGLDIVVSNAGIELLGQDDRVDRLDRAIWDRLLATNLTGPVPRLQAWRAPSARRRRRRDRLPRLELRLSRHGDQRTGL